MQSKKLEAGSFLVFCVGILVLTFFVFRPFLHILVLAAVLAVLFQPLYRKFVSLSVHRNLATLAIVLLVCVFLILPILFFGFQILAQAQTFFALSHDGQGQYVQTIQQGIESAIRHVFPDFSFSLSDYIAKVLGFISANLAVLISQTAYIFFQTFLLLCVFFFFLRDGESVLESVISLSLFGVEQNKKIVISLHRTITSVIRGILFVGIIRWVLLIAGFYFFGIPNALFWASLGAIIAAVPGLGTPFAIVPAILYIFFTGSGILSIGMASFGILLMVGTDNILSVYFFGKGLNAPPIFVLFSLIGGLIYFGPLGFIFGPLVLSLFMSALDMYQMLIMEKKE